MTDDPEEFTGTPLYATEEQIARRVFGRGPKNLALWKSFAKHLADQGMPEQDPMTRRRYWPAVLVYLHRREGLVHPSDRSSRGPLVPDGKENWEANKPKPRRRTD